MQSKNIDKKDFYKQFKVKGKDRDNKQFSRMVRENRIIVNILKALNHLILIVIVSIMEIADIYQEVINKKTQTINQIIQIIIIIMIKCIRKLRKFLKFNNKQLINNYPKVK